MNEAQEASSLEDRNFIQAFQVGNKTAFDSLVLKYQHRIYNLCYRFLGNHEDANDAAQETFVRVFRALPKFRQDASFGTWIYRIAINVCKSQYSSSERRRQKSFVRLDDKKIAGEEGAVSMELRDPAPDSLKRLEMNEKQEKIQKAIDSLPEEQKKVLILRDIEGLSYEEIAQMTQLNLGTVKSKLARARQFLQEKIRGFEL